MLTLVFVLVGTSNWLLSEKILRPLVNDQTDGHVAGVAIALLPLVAMVGVAITSRRQGHRSFSRWAMALSVIATWSLLVGIASIGGRHASRASEERIDRVLPGYREGYMFTLVSWFAVAGITIFCLKKSGRLPDRAARPRRRRTQVHG